MKKAILFFILSLSFSMIHAQVKTDLQDYTGRYTFPQGSMADDAVISIVNDTVLNITASAGDCDLKYVEGDTFSMPQYGGSIVFNRNKENKIDGFKLSIPMAGIDSLEASKERDTKLEEANNETTLLEKKM